MKVFLLKNIEKIGMAGEIVKVKEGFADNFLIPRKLAVAITPKNEAVYLKKQMNVGHRKDVVSSQSSMLAEKIKSLKVSLKRKMHDNGQLYGSINRSEIVDVLKKYSISVAKNQILLPKQIKSKGMFDITVKLSSKLQPTMKLNIISE